MLLVEQGVTTAIQTMITAFLNLPPAAQLGINLTFQMSQTLTQNRFRYPLPMLKALYIQNRVTENNRRVVQVPDKRSLSGYRLEERVDSAPGPVDMFQTILSELLIEWMKPNLGGIIINATNESQSRSIEIAENMIIIQSTDNVNKEYNTDNSAPHPRTWQVEGYLASALPWVDELFILRPTLVLQQLMLDAYATSRKPVLYKSGLAPFVVPVLIENYEIGRVIEGTNGYSIRITLREFVTYTVPLFNPSGVNTDMLIDPSTGVQVPIQVTAVPL